MSAISNSRREHRPRNVDYWFCGNPAVKPVAASDDGVHTRLTFATKAELPAIFVRNDDGFRVALEFQHGRGGCRHSSRGGEVHRAPGPLDGVHRQ